MGAAKTMSDEQLADLGTDLSQMHKLAVSVWERAMGILPIKSPEYRGDLCCGPQDPNRLPPHTRRGGAPQMVTR